MAKNWPENDVDSEESIIVRWKQNDLLSNHMVWLLDTAISESICVFVVLDVCKKERDLKICFSTPLNKMLPIESDAGAEVWENVIFISSFISILNTTALVLASLALDFCNNLLNVLPAIDSSSFPHTLLLQRANWAMQFISFRRWLLALACLLSSCYNLSFFCPFHHSPYKPYKVSQVCRDLSWAFPHAAFHSWNVPFPSESCFASLHPRGFLPYPGWTCQDASMPTPCAVRRSVCQVRPLFPVRLWITCILLMLYTLARHFSKFSGCIRK